jgi:hypothetical protein
MNKEVKAGESHVESDSNRHKHLRPNQQSSGGSAQRAENPIPQTQEGARSDQEQVGRQNPAGDTRDVSREPVKDAEHLPKK